jgi:hypothetical protein
MFSFALGAKEKLTYKKWIDLESKLLPPDITITFPDINIKIDKIDQKLLSFSNDPEKRNAYINESYFVLGQSLNECLDIKGRANWYHFAAWASKSAGEIINGQKFEDLKRAERGLLKSFGNWKIVYSEQSQRQIFASTNAIIAMEMIPLGNLFIETYCDGRNAENFDLFARNFIPKTKNEHILIQSFAYYLKAKKEVNPLKKEELLLLASIKQVESEQIRIDHLLDKVFWIKTKTKLIRKFFKRVATKKGKLEIGNNFMIDLTKNLKFVGYHKRPKTVSLIALIDEFKKHNISIPLKEDVLRVGTSDWSSLKERARFLFSFFWSYMYSENILKSPMPSANYFKSTNDLKKNWDSDTLSPGNPALLQTYQEINEKWLLSQDEMGEEDQMRKRSKIFLDLYKENNNFLFGLSTAHLTLAIDRFASTGPYLFKKFPSLQKKKTIKDLIIWGKELRQINKKMTQLLLFSHKVFYKSNYPPSKIINAVKNNHLIFNDLIEIIGLNKSWKTLKSPKLQLSKSIKITNNFIEWEHRTVIKPRLNKSLMKIGEKLESWLKKVPGKIFEKILPKTTRVKTTISLDCFEEEKHIHTKDFLNTEERIIRAKEFLHELKKIDFDPTMTCFDDEYYNYSF